LLAVFAPQTLRNPGDSSMSSQFTRRSLCTRLATKRSLKPRWDQLEVRALLSSVPFVAQPTFVLKPAGFGPDAQTFGYTPAQIAQAYQFSSISFNGVAGTGKGETIAIVDAYDDPNIQSDLNTFDSTFGLPATTVIRVNETGGAAYPATDPTGGWELEESLDVEWAHAMAPGATILLVEASSPSFGDLLAAIQYAETRANVVSMSWGGGEFGGESGYDSSYFQHSGVAFVASSGDSGAPAEWPAVSPDVLGVGGTALSLGAGNAWLSETGWSGSGGGPSLYESQPSYQSGVVTQTSTARATPDVAYDASPSTGVAVYDSYPYERQILDWIEVGGTSAGAPQWSAILAIADQGRAASGQPALDSTNPQQVMGILYQNPSALHDITSGTSTGSPEYSAGSGYDYVTGMGSPMANLVVEALDGTSSPAPPPSPSPDKLVLAAASVETAGAPFSLTVTADNSSGAIDTGYSGTIHFTSSDAQAGLPQNFTFSPSDGGTHRFSVTLKTAGNQSITATDVAHSATTGIVSGINVSPAAASQLVLSAASSTATVGVPQLFTVTAKDPYGNVASSYAGTVHFTSSDTAASLPGSFTYGASNQGVETFSVTFGTAGTQSVTVTDNLGHTATESGISVAPAAPTSLTASAVSSSQINLSWTGSSGATGYLIQQSLNSSTGWTEVGATSGGGSTTFQDSGLSAGTTYYFRVIAAAGSIDSAYSNVASATTTGAAPITTAGSIWSNSYVPHESAYSYGYYELGVKFTSSLAGEVTGIRFYKQTWMGGYLHVGHLWSSAGTLLATAMFTSETAYGWQQVNLSTPVPIQANTEYVVSFSTGGGYFGITTGFFSSGGVTNGSLEALPNSVAGGDGVYARGGQFPYVDSNGMNFWADVAFSPTSGGSPAAKISGGGSESGAGGGLGMAALGGGMTRLPRFFATPRQSMPTGPRNYFAGTGGRAPTILGALPSNTPSAPGGTLGSLLKKPWLLPS
jgi:hypothetical protein